MRAFQSKNTNKFNSIVVSPSQRPAVPGADPSRRMSHYVSLHVTFLIDSVSCPWKLILFLEKNLKQFFSKKDFVSQSFLQDFSWAQSSGWVDFTGVAH